MKEKRRTMDLNRRSTVLIPHLLKDGTLDLGKILGRVEVLKMDNGERKIRARSIRDFA
jgi:hypothetical protein